MATNFLDHTLPYRNAKLLCVAAGPFGDGADGYTAGAFGLPGFIVVDPGGAGDV